MKNEAREDEKVVNKRERERESCDKKSGQKSFHHASEERCCQGKKVDRKCTMGDDVARKKKSISIFFNESVLRLMEEEGSVNDRIMEVFCGIKVGKKFKFFVH